MGLQNNTDATSPHLSAASASCGVRYGGIWSGTGGPWWCQSGRWCTQRCPAPIGCWCRWRRSVTWTSSSKSPSCPAEHPGSVHHWNHRGGANKFLTVTFNSYFSYKASACSLRAVEDATERVVVFFPPVWAQKWQRASTYMVLYDMDTHCSGVWGGLLEM